MKISAPQADARTITFGVCKTLHTVWQRKQDTDGMICTSVPELDAASIQEASRVLGVPVLAVGFVSCSFLVHSDAITDPSSMRTCGKLLKRRRNRQKLRMKSNASCHSSIRLPKSTAPILGIHKVSFPLSNLGPDI